MSKRNKAPAIVGASEEVQVRVITDSHTHEGRDCKQGDVLTVDAERAQWMQEQGAAEIISTPAE